MESQATSAVAIAMTEKSRQEGIGTLKLIVSDIRQATPSIKLFHLVAADGGLLPAFDAGAHLVFALSNGRRNSYSLASDPSDLSKYTIAVLRENAGKGGSAFMHDTVRVGAQLEASGPANAFPLSQEASRHLLIAGGIGITPLLAMGYTLRNRGADFHLHYCARSAEHAAFRDEVNEVFAGRVTYHFDGGNSSEGIKLDAALADVTPGRHLYVCGPANLVKAARQAAAHWPRSAVHYELFTSENANRNVGANVETSDVAFEVHCAKSGVTLSVPVGRSILQVLSDNNIDVPYSCEEGWCGSCIVRCLEGEVAHRDEFLSDKERKSYMQVCVSRAASEGERLVLDI